MTSQVTWDSHPETLYPNTEFLTHDDKCTILDNSEVLYTHTSFLMNVVLTELTPVGSDHGVQPSSLGNIL